MARRELLLLLLATGSLSVPVPQAAAGVFKCIDADGNVLYANSPCEKHGATTRRKFTKSDLRPNTVKMPKAPPPVTEADAADGPGGLIGSLRQKPIDPEKMIREGDPDRHPGGGVRHPVLEKLFGKGR
ncbi:MAG: DUF4124 domain-containing protein [Betaproteobacteria bacterium]|nr:DUF4124 domain-containing protein [Betaproteobacteria bacterium]